MPKFDGLYETTTQDGDTSSVNAREVMSPTLFAAEMQDPMTVAGHAIHQ